jgi:hypothetical protein
MNKFATGLVCVVGMAGLMMAGSPPSYAQNGCRACAGKTTTSYRCRTVNRVKNVTRYRDTTRTHVARRLHRTVTVTRVQPITRVHLVNRVHNRVVFRTVNQNVAQTRMLPARTITTSKTIQLGRRCPCG